MTDLDNGPAPTDGSNMNELACLSDEEDLAIGRRWDPLGEEKEENVTLAKDILDERYSFHYNNKKKTLIHIVFDIYINIYVSSNILGRHQFKATTLESKI